MFQNVSFKKYLLSSAIGFGLGGALWGWEAFRGTVGAGEVFSNPFSYILGAIIMGFMGGISLVLFSKNIKRILLSGLLGVIGCFIGFIGIGVFSYYLFLYGGLFLSSITAPIISAEILKKFINLEPSLIVGGLWLVFLIAEILSVYFMLLR